MKLFYFVSIYYFAMLLETKKAAQNLDLLLELASPASGFHSGDLTVFSVMIERLNGLILSKRTFVPSGKPDNSRDKCKMTYFCTEVWKLFTLIGK